jgi:hypothetical protein
VPEFILSILAVIRVFEATPQSKSLRFGNRLPFSNANIRDQD